MRKGNETTIDYLRMMRIVRDAGYRGYVGIEFEGRDIEEPRASAPPRSCWSGCATSSSLPEPARTEFVAGEGIELVVAGKFLAGLLVEPRRQQAAERQAPGRRSGHTA